MLLLYFQVYGLIYRRQKILNKNLKHKNLLSKIPQMILIQKILILGMLDCQLFKSTLNLRMDFSFFFGQTPLLKWLHIFQQSFAGMKIILVLK